MALARIEVVGQQNVADPFSYIFLMFFLGGPGLGWNWREDVVEQLAGPLVEAEAHHTRLGGLAVHVEHVLQVGQVVARDGADAPHLFQPRFELTFFNTLRIVSLETAGP